MKKKLILMSKLFLPKQAKYSSPYSLKMSKKSYQTIKNIVEQIGRDCEPTAKFIYRAKDFIRFSGERLGVFSASFNPLTFAHLKIIELAEAQRDLKEVLLLLAKANVDKDIFGAPLDQRLKVLECYARNESNLSVAVCSHGRFIDKIFALKKLYPSNTEFFFIIGYDTLVRIFDQKYYTDMDKELDELFSQSRFIVANRGKDGVKSINDYLMKNPISQKYINKFDTIHLEEPYAQISSTEVRECVSNGNSIEKLVPEFISDWIEKKGFYH